MRAMKREGRVCGSVHDQNGVVVVPAFAGLGVG